MEVHKLNCCMEKKDMTNTDSIRGSKAEIVFFSMARFDRFYSFKHHFCISKECIILPVAFSDHSMVYVFIAHV